MSLEKNYTTNEYFFDTYAFIELLKNNPSYAKYAKRKMIITQLNLFEMSYFALRELDESTARMLLQHYQDNTVEYDSTVIYDAVRLKRQKQKLSMTDCIGYITAARLGIKFLTGDQEFKEMKNVEFVK